jgi:hypothetical protein
MGARTLRGNVAKGLAPFFDALDRASTIMGFGHLKQTQEQ